jgi:hypothetical protein
MKIYEGYRLPDGRCRVAVSNNGHKRPLPPRNKLFNHSPTGFEWGHSGSGPAQLALPKLRRRPSCAGPHKPPTPSRAIECERSTRSKSTSWG